METKRAVFYEQYRQTVTQSRDDEKLAKKARQTSRRARNFACLLGQADAWAVKANKSDDEGKYNDESGPEPRKTEED
jgi:hypothetical protein